MIDENGINESYYGTLHHEQLHYRPTKGYRVQDVVICSLQARRWKKQQQYNRWQQKVQHGCRRGRHSNGRSRPDCQSMID
ncbi:unnamed protein product, partial [Ectocarpus sp. 13 AM-2016]